MIERCKLSGKRPRTWSVRVGVGIGHEDRIQENRRLKLSSGKEVDVRHAYSMPADDEVAAVGPIDPEIGILRLDRKDGSTLAVVYNFACHPIQGVPGNANTADITGFSSEVKVSGFELVTSCLSRFLGSWSFRSG